MEVTVYMNGSKLGSTAIKSDFLPRSITSDEDLVEKMSKVCFLFAIIFAHLK